MPEEGEKPRVAENLEPSPVTPEQVKKLFSTYEEAQLSSNRILREAFTLVHKRELSFEEEVERDKKLREVPDVTTRAFTLAEVLETLGQKDRLKAIQEAVSKLEPVFPQK